MHGGYLFHLGIAQFFEEMLLDGYGLFGHIQFRHAFFGEIPSVVVGTGELHASMVVHLHQILGPALFLAAQFQREQ